VRTPSFREPTKCETLDAKTKLQKNFSLETIESKPDSDGNAAWQELKLNDKPMTTEELIQNTHLPTMKIGEHNHQGEEKEWDGGLQRRYTPERSCKELFLSLPI
jgi:hypothetical protein